MSQSRVTLVYPRPAKIKAVRFGYSLSLLRLSAILKRAGHEVSYIDFSERADITEDYFLKEAESKDIVIIELDSFPLKRSDNVAHGLRLGELIKRRNNDVITIAFGKDCILQTRQLDYFDYTFTSEPEWSILDVISSLKTKGQEIDSLRIDDNNLDLLPFPDRSLLSEHCMHGGSINHPPNLEKSALIQTSMGCLNTCTFCQRKGWNSAYRETSIEYSLKEFEMLYAESYKNVWISDDNFTFHLQRAKSLLKFLIQQGITKGMKLSLSSWTHIDEEFLEIAKSAGVSIISFGVESTNTEILDFYRKKIDINRFSQLISYADEIGIYTIGNFIIGAPMESNETISKSMDFAIVTPFDDINIKILDYMIGSELYAKISDSLKGKENHYFACREHGLNRYPLSELQYLIERYNASFKSSRSDKMRAKILKHGTPYMLLSNHSNIVPGGSV